jgi:mannose-6-phosphate isomerase-like protein (cupin superfamily)
MSKVMTLADQNWKTRQLGDFTVSDCPLWEGGDIYTGLFRLPKGFTFPHHTHRGWVQIYVLSGSIQVRFDDGARDMRVGEYYVVEKGDAHEEVVQEDGTTIFVASGEGRDGLYDPVNLPGELAAR